MSFFYMNHIATICCSCHWCLSYTRTHIATICCSCHWCLSYTSTHLAAICCSCYWYLSFTWTTLLLFVVPATDVSLYKHQPCYHLLFLLLMSLYTSTNLATICCSCYWCLSIQAPTLLVFGDPATDVSRISIHSCLSGQCFARQTHSMGRINISATAWRNGNVPPGPDVPISNANSSGASYALVPGMLRTMLISRVFWDRCSSWGRHWTPITEEEVTLARLHKEVQR